MKSSNIMKMIFFLRQTSAARMLKVSNLQIVLLYFRFAFYINRAKIINEDKLINLHHN